MPPSCQVHHWDTLSADVAGGVRRMLIAGDGADLKRVEIPAGTTAERHDHPHEQFVLVLEGTGRLTSAEGTCDLRPGTVLHLTAHTWHAAVFETATVLIEVNLRPEMEA